MRGLINMAFDGRTFNPGTPVNEHFAGVFAFLNGPIGQSLGIQRIAYNTGNNPGNLGWTPGAGGMGYWDSTQTGIQSPAGQNCWAVFQFTQATPNFYMLIQSAVTDNGGGEGHFGASPGNPATVQYFYDNGTNRDCNAVAFAVRDDGGNPWNGTTLNNGSDTKGTPVWTAGASTVALFPRANNRLGDRVATADGMMGIWYNSQVTNQFYNMNTTNPSGYNFDNVDGVAHMLVDTNKIFFIANYFNIGNATFLYFGPYVPLKPVNSAPYVCIAKHHSSDQEALLTLGNSIVYGGYNIGGGGYNPMYQGGIVHPATRIACSISINDDPRLGTLFGSPDRVVSPDPKPGFWDWFNPMIAMNEYPNNYGIVGEIDAFKLTFSPHSCATFNSRSWAEFGSNYQNQIKVLVPWDSKNPPSAVIGNRYGTIF